MSCSTPEINKVFPSIHVYLCLLYKGKFIKQNLKPVFINLAVYSKAIIFTCEITINNFACAIISFISARNPYKNLSLYNKVILKI